MKVMVLAASAWVSALAFGDAPALPVTVDFTRPAGPVKAMHGVNNSPVRLGRTQDEFREAGIPFCRLHDTGGAFGGAVYVDIPNVFPDFDADENDPASYRFKYTDELLKPLVAAGTEPFYRLGVTIENNWAICGPWRIHPPKDFAKWARICEHIILHYNEGWANGFRWNLKYWEIWNEPEGEGLWTGTQEEFARFYSVAARHLKARFPHLMIGGPGTIGFYSIDDPEPIKWHDDLLDYQKIFFDRVEADKVPLDFYAWHLYTDDPDRIARHAEYARRLLDSRGHRSAESFLDEWNFPHRDWDGMKAAKGAAFVASAFCLMQQGPVDKAMYYDALPTRAYCGLFYFPNGRTTPCYQAFKAWNTLYRARNYYACMFPSNGVYAAAAADDRAKRILLVNYGVKSRTLALKVLGAEGETFRISRLDETRDTLTPDGTCGGSGAVRMPPNSLALLECGAPRAEEKTAAELVQSLPTLGVTNVVEAWQQDVPEGKHVAVYSRRICVDLIPDRRYVLDLGEMRGKARVAIDAREFPPLWRKPYMVDITMAVRRSRYGQLNTRIEVTPPDPSVPPQLGGPIRVIVLPGEEKTTFSDWPEGKDPETIARRVIGQFLSTSPWGYFPKGYGGKAPYSPDHVAYAIASLWVNALDCARQMHDTVLERRLVEKFEPVFGERADMQTKVNHLDFTIFGAVPLEIARLTGDRRALALGLRYADFQWAKPDPARPLNHDATPFERQMELWRDGYSHQSRLWIDDMYMITLLQVQAYRATRDAKYITRAAHELALYLEKLQRKDGLFNHAEGVPFVWCRGAGWVAAGMALVLEDLPETDPNYARIRDGFRRMMAALLKHQRADGLWGQVVDDPEFWTETSGSAMFTFAFLSGVRSGLLDAASYAEPARKAYLALCDRLDAYGNLTGVCVGTNRKNSRDWYMNRPRIVGDPHGQAPMLWICGALLKEP